MSFDFNNRQLLLTIHLQITHNKFIDIGVGIPIVLNNYMLCHSERSDSEVEESSFINEEDPKGYAQGDKCDAVL